MISLEGSFFFDQASFRPPTRRYKKLPDDLPQSLRFAQLNPKLAGFYKDSKQNEDGTVREDGSKDGPILHEVSSIFTGIKNQLLADFLPDYDSARQILEESKSGAPTLLEELARLLPLVKVFEKKINFPRSLLQHLQSTYEDLVYDAKYVKREWQLHDNQVKHEAELQAKKTKESNENDDNGDNKKSRGDNSESDDDGNKGDITGSSSQKTKTQYRKLRRQIQSQPAIVEESINKRNKLTTPKKARHGSAPKKPVTAPSFKNDMEKIPAGYNGDDGISEASQSKKRWLNLHYIS